MEQRDWLVQQFEAQRGHLRGVAYRMLGSSSEADDAVQEAWLRLSHTGADGIDNLGGWLTTVVGRICLDMLRSRKARREEPLDVKAPGPVAIDPQQEAELADSVGVALLIVLDALEPAERLAFVLHDLFGVSFEDIGGIVDRTPAAARQLASRARRRVQGAPATSEADLVAQRKVVDTFLHALRAGDMNALLAVLDPDLVVRTDSAATRPGAPNEVRGAQNWAKGAVAYAQVLGAAHVALVDGAIGLVFAPHGRVQRVLELTFKDGKITRMDVIADTARLGSIVLQLAPS